MKQYLFLVLLVGAVCSSNARVSFEDRLYKDTIDFIHECGSTSLTLCLKEKTLRYVEKLPSDIDVGGGIRIKQNEVERLSRQHSPSADLPAESSAREDVIDRVLLERIAEYLSSHTVEFKLPADTVKDLQMSAEEGRKKKGGDDNNKKGSMFPLMLMFQLKAVTLGAIAIKLIGLVAFKALLIAKVAFTIASVIALKKLLESKHHSSTYEVVAHPHVEDYSHYDRSFSQDIAYKAQQKKPATK